jgi:hypothetical protein
VHALGIGLVVLFVHLGKFATAMNLLETRVIDGSVLVLLLSRYGAA